MDADNDSIPDLDANIDNTPFVDAYRQTYAAIASRDAPHVPLVFATPGQAAVCGAEGGLAPAEAVQL